MSRLGYQADFAEYCSIGRVLPTWSGVDRPTHQIGFRKLDRQAPTRRRKVQSQSKSKQVPHVPRQFTWTQRAAVFQPSTVSCSLPPSSPPRVFLCLRLPPSIDLRDVT